MDYLKKPEKLATPQEMSWPSHEHYQKHHDSRLSALKLIGNKQQQTLARLRKQFLYNQGDRSFKTETNLNEYAQSHY